MAGYRNTATGTGDSAPSEAWLFAQAILGKPVPNPYRARDEARAEREQLEWLAQISPGHAVELRKLQSAAAEARRERELLVWAAGISTKAEAKLRTLLREEAEVREAQDRHERLYEAYSARITEWDEADHPRRGYGSHPGAWVNKGDAGGSSGSGKLPSFLDAVIRRNQMIAELTGVVTPGMIRSTRIAVELQSAARLPGEVARAAAAGLGTGGKAVVNGFATAVKDVATLGLSPGQLELIGVTKEDRDRGYDTAVSISTASGQVLIAVGTGGMASALSKGGSIARTASGALVAFDAAGNAVGVVQGVYDATQNGVNISNGAQVAGGLLGLSANAMAVRDLSRVSAGRRLAEVDEFVAKLPRKTTPTNSVANQYEIKHTGPYNYKVSGGGESFAIDGYRGSTILEAKHVGKASDSPYIPGSSCPEPVRAKILAKTREELRKVRTIIESGSTPFKSVEVITNSPEAKRLFEAMLKESRVPGTVRFEP
jgi:hypothetical protein